MHINKKGSASIFLVITLASVLLVASVLIRSAGLAAGRSYGDAVFLLSGRSVLSEFDRKLFDNYGILGMRGDEETIREKLRYYSDASLKQTSGGLSGGVWLLPCSTGDIDVDLKGYSLIDINVFEKQIFDDINNILVNNLRDYLLPEKDDTNNDSDKDSKTDENRSIGNKAIINNLPSQGLDGGMLPITTIISQGIPDLDDLINGAGDVFLTTEYALARFTAAKTKIPRFATGHEHFFRNEIEYIIAGKYSDKDNYNSIITRLSLLRFALNEVTLHTNSEMIKEVNLVASLVQSIIPPGPWTPFIRELVIAAWCAIETANDILLLEHGEKVPIYKKGQNWATGSDSIVTAIEDYILSGIDAGDMSGIEAQALSTTSGFHGIKPRVVEGFTYIDHLRMFLYFTPRDTKLLRIMDLIQLNMKVGYYSDFLIQEHFTGFRYQVVMNKDIYNYEQRYRKD